MKKRLITLCGMFITSASMLYSQHFEGNVWCFGGGARVDFSTTSPYSPTTPTTKPSTFVGTYYASPSAGEGVYSISDPNGNLLFYTDGQSVYDAQTKDPSDATKDKKINTVQLNGHYSSTQSGIIVPVPGSVSPKTNIPTSFYIFTVDAWAGANSVEYTILNRDDNGVYSFGATNQFLPMDGSKTTNDYRFSEKITAVKKSDGFGFYLISQIAYSTTPSTGNLAIWDISCTGIKFSSMPQVNVTCNVTGSNPSNVLGYIKGSPNGDKIALASYGNPGYAAIFNFDNSTGIISNEKSINISQPYGLEFSPDGNLLYVGSFTTGNITKIKINDMTTNITPVGSDASSLLGGWIDYKAGALQLGPDGNIYIARPGRTYIDRIETPNNLGTFIINNKAINLSTINGIQTYSTLGLPNFITTLFGKAEISVNKSNCSVAVNYAGGTNLISPTYAWDFGDGTTSIGATPNHSYNEIKTYIVKLKVTNPSGCTAYAQQTVVIDKLCCDVVIDPRYSKYTTNQKITSKTVWDDKIYIDDNVTLTVDNTTLDITNVDVVFGSGAQIVFTNGAILRANNSVFRTCDETKVWKGLQFIVNNGGLPSGNIDNCMFKNAKSAIEVTDSDPISPTYSTIDIKITNNEFNNCMVGIALNSLNFKRSITNNVYTVDNTNLPFASLSTKVVVSAQVNYAGILAKQVKFIEPIASNDFIFTSPSLNTSGAEVFALILQQGSANSSSNVTKNNFVNTRVYIAGNKTTTGVQVENNSFTKSKTITDGSNPAQYQLYLVGLNASLIKGNTFYENGFNSRTTKPTTPNAAIGMSICNQTTINENSIIGYEVGIYLRDNQNLYIKSNQIKKSKYYGIYSLNNVYTDITCNTIDLQLGSSVTSANDNTGIAVFWDGNFALSFPSILPTGAIRSNCILNTYNGIYAKNTSGVSKTLPLIANNYLYNYLNSGVYTQSFTGNTSTPYSIRKNTFQSNNANGGAGLVDVYSNAGFVFPIEYNYGIVNVASGIANNNINQSYSTASCAGNIGVLSQGGNLTLNSNNGEQYCDYYFQAQNTSNTWNTQVRISDNNNDSDTLYNVTYDNSNSIINITQDKVEVYPNPTSTQFEIEYVLNNINQDSKIEVYNSVGNKIITRNINSNVNKETIDLSNVDAGLYFVKVISANEKTTIVKVVKK